MPKVNMDALSKGELRKLNALRKSVGDDLGADVFAKWLAQQATATPQVDKVAEKITGALEAAGFAEDKSFRLGNYGYTIRKARGKGASGFVAVKNDAG